jgi:hypothetical protein
MNPIQEPLNVIHHMQIPVQDHIIGQNVPQRTPQSRKIIAQSLVQPDSQDRCPREKVILEIPGDQRFEVLSHPLGNGSPKRNFLKAFRSEIGL